MFDDVAGGTPGKSPTAKRSADEATRSAEQRGVSQKQRSAKAREGAMKYLDGAFGSTGGHGTFRKAADWVKAELQDTHEWDPKRMAYHVDKSEAHAHPHVARAHWDASFVFTSHPCRSPSFIFSGCRPLTLFSP